MKIGLIVAIELDAVKLHYPKMARMDAPAGFELYRTEVGENELLVLKTGMGEVYASAGTQYLISACGVSAIVNFGVVGGLTAQMGHEKLCLLNRIVHYKYDCSEFLDLPIGQVEGRNSVFICPDETLLAKVRDMEPDLPLATCCSGDKFVGTTEEKQSLHERFEGDVCDMESSGIALTCELNQIPCVFIKAVADGLSGGAGEFFAELQAASLHCFELTDRIIGLMN